MLTKLPHPLGVTGVSNLAEDIGSLWNIGLNGRGFLLSTLDQESPFEFRAYSILAIPIEKPRLDQSDEPGEQTLFPWWTRAQHSFHEGAGQEVFDSPFSSRFAFETSKGVDPWTEGELTLLHETREVRSDVTTDHHLHKGPDALFYTSDGQLVKDPDPTASGDETTLANHQGTPVNSITSDGEKIYLAFSGGTLGIKSVVMSPFGGFVDVNSQTDVDLIGFVKGRLIGAKVNQLFDYDLTTTTPPAAHYTDEATDWQFTGITEVGPGILVSGFSGDRSEIMIMRLTAQDISSGLTLGVPRNVWTAPEGETIHSIRGYLGNSVVIGTSKGVRVGLVSTGEGDLDVSPLVVETDDPVKTLEPQGDYCWFGWTKFDGTSSGLGRLHLGDLAYASDIMETSQGEIYSSAEFDGLLYFSVQEGSTSRIIGEHPDNLEAEGFIQSGEIRFGTTERKALRFLDVNGEGPGTWSGALSVDGATFNSHFSDVTMANSERIISLDIRRLKLKLTLKRDTATTGPKLREWRLRAEPRANGRFRYIVPVMLYDHMTTLNGASVGREGYAWELLDFLMNIYREDLDFTFQTPATKVPGTSNTAKAVKMEDFQFKAFTPPKGCRGFGGIGLVMLRDLR